VILHGPGKPEEAWESRPAPVLSEQTAEYAEEWAVAVGTHKLLKEGVYSAGARVGVRWEKKSLRCVTQVAGREVWRCGRREAPNRLDGAGNQRVARLEKVPGDSAAESFALDLLDTGSADVVVIGRDPSPSRTLVLGQPFLAFPAASSWQSLSLDLRFIGTKTVEEVWPAGRYLAQDPKARIRGLYDMEFVDIPGGTFTMGSADTDPQAYTNEQPAHKVTLSAYSIGKYEVTEAQLRGGGSDTRPAVNVSWYEAKAFCDAHGWRLPTEAEWEYAARAGTATAWSFGDDERLLGEYAWFGEDFGGAPHPVGTKKPNPWGLYDMHGNAWEWVADWYGPYSREAQVDPGGPSAREYRVLRGGAFGVPPRFLRSAYRFRFQPSFRFRDVGFRCARSSHPPAPSPIALPPTGRGGGG
jgi:formylglycine-generating enzyme required for sulfatase activity